MKPEKQRIAIATACGEDVSLCDIHQSRVCCGRSSIPPYLTSLDAMHEAEKTLDGIQAMLMHNYLQEIGERPAERGKGVLYLPDVIRPWRATAPQRAEAFLRTLGLWEEGEQ